MKTIKLTKKEIEWIIWEIDGSLESSLSHRAKGIQTFKAEDYCGDYTQSELNTMKSLKEKLK